MTSVNSTNSSSTALLLLQGASLRSSNGNQNAGGTSLAATSNNSDPAIATIKRLASAWEAKKASQPARTSSEANAGGTVSSAASSVWKSGMANAAAAAMGASTNTAESAGGTSIARTAEILVGWLASDINDYNGKFELQEIEAPEEWAAYKDEWLAKEREMGVSEDRINNGLKMLFEEGGYERHVSHIDAHNQGLLRLSEIAEDRLHNADAQRLKEAFGTNVQISYDNEGRASVTPFDIYYRNGQKMVSYGEDGSLTSYNADGTVKLALSNEQAAQIPGGAYRS